MTITELKRRYGDSHKQLEAEIEEAEGRFTREHRERCKAMFREAGEKLSNEAGLEDAYYELFPVGSALPPGAPLVETSG